MAPPVGPERGGTRVAVLGGGFRDAYTLRCAFSTFAGADGTLGAASSSVLARYVDESQLECTTAVHAPGSVSHSRKKRLTDAPKGVGIKKKRRVKMK